MVLIHVFQPMEARRLNPLEIANTLWAYAILAISPPPRELLDPASLRRVASQTTSYRDKDLAQL